MSEHKHYYEYVINPRDLIALHVATDMLISKLDQQIKDQQLNGDSFSSKYKAELQQLLNNTHYSNLKRINATNVD
jgi:hypothetical protein